MEDEKLGSLREVTEEEEPGREVTEEEEPGREDIVEHTGSTLAGETASEWTRALPDERVEDGSYIH